MRTIRVALLVLAMTPWSPLALADSAKAIIQFKSDIVSLYDDPEGERISVRLPRGEIATPVSIEEESGDYVRIRLNDKGYWVSALKVQINYPAARCDMHQQVASTAAARGIGEGCKAK